MKKVAVILGAIIAIFSIVPLNFMAWWTRDSEFLGSHNYWHLTGFGIRINNSGEYALIDPIYLIPGIVVLLGVVLMFAGTSKENGALSAIGGILSIGGPIVFLLVLSSNASVVQSETLVPASENIIWGSFSFGATLNWYLNLGFFLPLGAGALALVGSN